ncbi:uncharacterized protein BYT42DRAFT_347282 [Radiomyces spectabilis]|uniref:uncharacterized protein n=1 Tax=Radiomyces spectabilis TaxID=64574 RepID=UPI00221F5094|nr:uncharacterized protein BYT42DRAFT_347282 [Radiomyces spectabilis]KAI8377524.1 hypothetical protein BYT42DRAFT_347282 [Radiomyces spectabilis]
MTFYLYVISSTRPFPCFIAFSYSLLFARSIDCGKIDVPANSQLRAIALNTRHVLLTSVFFFSSFSFSFSFIRFFFLKKPPIHSFESSTKAFPPPPLLFTSLFFSSHPNSPALARAKSSISFFPQHFIEESLGLLLLLLLLISRAPFQLFFWHAFLDNPTLFFLTKKKSTHLNDERSI